MYLRVDGLLGGLVRRSHIQDLTLLGLLSRILERLATIVISRLLFRHTRLRRTKSEPYRLERTRLVLARGSDVTIGHRERRPAEERTSVPSPLTRLE